MLFSPLGRLRNMVHHGYPVAVDFGVGAMKVLHLSPGESEDTPKLEFAAEVVTPDDIAGDHAKRLVFQATELAKLSKQLGLKGKRAVCAIPAVQTFCKHMQFNRGDATPVAQLVRAAVPQQVGCHPDALLYRHVEVDLGPNGGPQGKNEVICMAAARDLVSRLMGALDGARMEPVGIHPEYAAVLRAFEHLGRAEDPTPTLYLDIGAGSTKALIAHGTKLVFAKTIHLGGRHLDQALARQCKCSPADARARRLSAKSLTGENVRPEVAEAGMLNPARASYTAEVSGSREMAAAVMAERAAARERGVNLQGQIETLTDEVAMCIRYHDGLFPGKRPARVVFVGGESRHKGLCQAVARAIRMPAQLADPMARVTKSGGETLIGTDLIGPQPGWTVALGLSLSPTDL
jgi:type IV pilus assembly protein PilM